MQSRNRVATELVDEAIDFADELGLEIHHRDNDGVVLDFGVRAAGGIEAGLLLTEIATGGLATAHTRMTDVGPATVPSIEFTTDHPVLALYDTQVNEWPLDGIDGFGFGPATLVREGARTAHPGYDDDFDFAVLAVQSPSLPDEAVVSTVASGAGVPTSGVFLPTAPAASLAGTIVAVARSVRSIVDRLIERGYDPGAFVAASSSAPLPPIAANEVTARTRAAAALKLGGRAHLVVADDASWLADLRDDPADGVLPARLTIDVLGGPTYRSGEIDDSALMDRFEE